MLPASLAPRPKGCPPQAQHANLRIGVKHFACGLLCAAIYNAWVPAYGKSSVLKLNDIGPQAYRDAMAHFAGHVHVVTTDGPAGKRGTTVIAACSV